jgi:hypothetical protein
MDSGSEVGLSVGFRLAISACQENSNPTSPDAGLAPAAARSSQGPELPSAAEESTPYWQPLQSAQATQIATEVADPVYVRKGPGCPANNGSLAITGSFNISSDDYTNTLGGCLMPLVYTVTNAGKAPLTLQRTNSIRRFPDLRLPWAAGLEPASRPDSARRSPALSTRRGKEPLVP